MAAGEGTRLRPLTERWAKPVLPIDGKPVVARLLRELAAAGFDEVTVVTGHLAAQVEALLGDGSGFGCRIRYVRQPGVLGSADAVLRAGAAAPYLVTAADTLFTEGDIERFWSAFAESGADGAVAARRDPPPSPPHRYALRIEEGVVRDLLDRDPGNGLAAAPLWALGPALQPILEALPGKAPYELATVFQEAIVSGLRIAGVEIGKTRDLTHPEDVVVENFPYLGST